MKRLSILLLAALLVAGCVHSTTVAVPKFGVVDETLLEDVSRGAFLYFWNEADPQSGLVRDKTGADVCSVAAMGFGLAALPVGVERGWISRSDGEDRAVRALRTLSASSAKHEGIYCHYVDLRTGGPTKNAYESGASSIDSALLFAGAIVAGGYFGGETQDLAREMTAGANWRAFVSPESGLVYMVWTPATPGDMAGPGEFAGQTWDWYSDETLLIALLGMSSPVEEHRLGPEHLANWRRHRGQFEELDYVYTWPGTLFTYMFCHCYVNFSRLGPDPLGVDWDFNTAMAARANRDWCRRHATEFKSYGRDSWGISACSGPGGSYVVPGHQPRGEAGENPAGGTVAPHAAAMALPFIPRDSIAALRYMRDLTIGQKPIWNDPSAGGYGFWDAYNAEDGWVSNEVIGIAQGPMLLMIENARTGLVQDLFMRDESIAAGLSRAGFGGAVGKPRPSGADEAYLRDLARDTWECIAYFVDPQTGLPYDTSERGEYSSATNLGFYVASCAVAERMGFIDHDEAVGRVQRVLDGYNRFEKWNGFAQCWNSVKDFTPMKSDRMVSLLDTGNMVSGFVVAARALPETRDEITRILGEMNWSAVYDPKAQLLYGGYNMGQAALDPAWHVGDYAGDGRMVTFWAIAAGGAPAESWRALGRRADAPFGLKVYAPGWAGGGLFMQIQNGLFLDEMSTPIGRSSANFAYAQMLYAKQLGLDAWGWSASWSPDRRYLGYGGLEVPVVTPHAAGMAAMYYPAKAVECLKTLETKGARRPFNGGDTARNFGFRDSVNLDTGDVCDLYLPALDQTMLFLALANALEDGVVQRLFMSDSTVQAGMQRIDEYTWPQDQGWLAELARRDREPITLPAKTDLAGPCPILVDDFERPNHTGQDDSGLAGDTMTTRLGGRIHTWTRDAADPTVTLAARREVVERDGATSGFLRVDYDVDSPNAAFGGLTIDLAGIPLGSCDAVEILARGVPDSLKIELHVKGGIGVARLRGVQKDRWTRITIPFYEFGGMITDWSSAAQLILVFEDSKSKPKTGTLHLDDIRFVHRQ